MLKNEAEVYAAMKGTPGIPRVHTLTTEGDAYVLVLDYIGPSVQELLEFNHNQFSVQTVFLLAEQMLNLLQELHGSGYIHRDIKPDNFLIGKSNTVYLIDFGFAKRYIDKKTKGHIPFRENKRLTGSPKFASLNAHLGYELSRRDDIESLGYTIIYMLKGKLPWESMKGSTWNKKLDEIMDIKMNLELDRLCKGMPAEVFHYMTRCRELMFDSNPEYILFKKEFRTWLNHNNTRKVFMYDWEKFGIDLEQVKGKLSGHESHKGRSPLLEKYENPEKLKEDEAKEQELNKQLKRRKMIDKLLAGLPKDSKLYQDIQAKHDEAEKKIQEDEKKKEEEKLKMDDEIFACIQCDYDPNDMVEHTEGIYY